MSPAPNYFFFGREHLIVMSHDGFFVFCAAVLSSVRDSVRLLFEVSTSARGRSSDRVRCLVLDEDRTAGNLALVLVGSEHRSVGARNAGIAQNTGPSCVSRGGWWKLAYSWLRTRASVVTKSRPCNGEIGTLCSPASQNEDACLPQRPQVRTARMQLRLRRARSEAGAWPDDDETSSRVH